MDTTAVGEPVSTTWFDKGQVKKLTEHGGKSAAEQRLSYQMQSLSIQAAMGAGLSEYNSWQGDSYIHTVKDKWANPLFSMVQPGGNIYMCIASLTQHQGNCIRQQNGK